MASEISGDRDMAIKRAALELSGEVGYERMTVEALISRSGSNRARFYRSYATKADCYAAAYEEWSAHLVGRLLGAGAAVEGWRVGFRRSLEEFSGFLAAERLIAKGLIAEVYVAGGVTLARRKEVFERLSRAIDRARRETVEPRHSPPPITSTFILSGIEAVALRTLHESGDFDESLPGLLYISIAPYFGEAAASAEVARLSQRG